MKLRRFTTLGLQEFQLWLKDASDTVISDGLLTGDLTSEPFLDVEIDETRKFASRFELGEYLTSIFISFEVNDLLSEKNDGLWAWIAALYMNQLLGKAARREEHYMVTRKGSTGSLAYRHAIRTPYELVRIHGTDANLCLNKPMHIFGDLTEQLASRQTIAHNRGFFRAAHKLYMTSGKLKPGVASKLKKPRDRKPGDRSGLGSVRRLAMALQRLDLTYDTQAMPSDDLVKLLPKEFLKWSR
jgi:hypothetical protein